MKYKEYGQITNPTIMLLHGGGLAPWSYEDAAKILQHDYHVIIPILDGHSGSDEDFSSIEHQATKLIAYINKEYNGQILMICGLSLGGQVLVEMLGMKEDICQYALIESALVLPMPLTYALIQPAFNICYPLIQKRWFAKLQFQSLHLHPKYFEDYFRDSKAITKNNMIAFLKANAHYTLKESIKNTKAHVHIVVGGKEAIKMKKSAQLLQSTIKNATIDILQGYHHGDLSINHGHHYVEIIQKLLLK